jgi:hypothetical protein
MNAIGVGAPFASAKITKVTIKAPFLGIKSVAQLGFSIVAYVNYKTCGMSAEDQVSSVKVDAVDVKFANFRSDGFTVYGDIEIGSSFAN